jgi:pyruvate formate lyase activating enzyme
VPSGAPDCPIKGIIDTSFIDWRGFLSTVLFTGGCNFRCPYCHNTDLVDNWKSLEDVPLVYIMDHFRRFRDWLDRVVITGGEPTIHSGLAGLIATLKGADLRVKLDTNGSNPAVLRTLLGEGLVDFIAMDVKGPLEQYERWCGIKDVDKGAIAESIALIIEAGIDHEFRMTVVPFLHKEKDVRTVAQYLRRSQRFTVQEFKPNNTLDPTFASIRPHTPEALERMRAAAARASGDTDQSPA